MLWIQKCVILKKNVVLTKQMDLNGFKECNTCVHVIRSETISSKKEIISTKKGNITGNMLAPHKLYRISCSNVS